jgi:heterokaryon incompatibility protein (HET)
MDAVYEKAETVIVWLGADDEGMAEDCFALILETNEYLDSQFKKHGRFFPILDTLSPISKDKIRWNTVQALYALPWFRRAWVVQEAGLGKECVLRWGAQKIDFAEVVELALYMGEHPDLIEFVSIRPDTGRVGDAFIEIQCSFSNAATWRRSKPFLAYWSDKMKEAPYFFLNVLDTARRLHASDERDFVYAFLGSPAAQGADGRPHVKPDYTSSKTANEVFVDVACALLCHKREAPHVLGFVQHWCEEDVQGRICPSWTPRWNRWECWSIAQPQFWYRAGGPVEQFHGPEIQLRKRLLLTGFQFDQVMWTSSTHDTRNFSIDSSEWDDVFRQARMPFIDHLWGQVVQTVGREDSSLEAAFLLTLVAECPNSEGPNTSLPRLQRNFDAYRHLARKRTDPNYDHRANIDSPGPVGHPRPPRISRTPKIHGHKGWAPGYR